MTDQQRKNLENIARAIRDGRKQITESFAIGQVMLVTGRPYDQAVKGLALMRSEKLFPDGFIDPKTDGALARMLGNTPNLKNLIYRLDLIPGHCNPCEFQGFKYPHTSVIEVLRKRFSVDGF